MIIRAADADGSWSEIETLLEDELSNQSTLKDVIDAIYSETGEFENVVFTTAKEFYDMLVSYEPKDVAVKFVNGINLDTNKSPAKPEAKYFRFDGDDYIESTNSPDKYYDEYIDDVIDWFKDNLETASQMKLPESILDILEDLI